MAARTLPLLLAVALAWHRPAHRLPLLIAAAGVGLAAIFTIVYVYPINAVLFEQAGGSGSPEQIRAMVSQWIWADRTRFAVGGIAFLCLLWAFRLPLRR